MRSLGQQLVVALMALAGMLATTRHAEAAGTAAFIRSDRLDKAAEPAAAQVEAELLGTSQLRWVERAKVQAALRERGLQETLGKDEPGARRRLGQILQADLLLILRPAIGAAGDAGELIICETRQGLRLARVPLSLAAKPGDTSARQAIAALGRAVERNSQPQVDLVAVYPFTSRNLTSDADGLKDAYARLIEQALEAQPGVWLVELQEAQAIAAEITTAKGNAAQRRLPLFVEGEFAHKDYSPTAPVTIQMTIKRGQAALKQWKLENLPSVEAPEALRRSTLQELAAVIGAEPAKYDPRQEAAELARRAGIAYRLGFWLEALQLAEASLLLNDNQPELHRDALLAGVNHVQQFEPQNDSEKAAHWRQNSAFLRRLVVHKEAYLRSRPIRMGGGDYPIGNALVLPEEVRKATAAAYLRMMQLRYEQGRKDELYMYFPHHFQAAPPEAAADVLEFKLRVADYWQPHMGGVQRLISNISFGWRDSDGPDMQAVIKRLEASPNETTRAAAAEMRRRLGMGLRVDVDPDARQMPRSDVELKPPVGHAKAEFFRLGIGYISGWMPAGPGVDVIWTYDPGRLYLMRKPGQTELIAEIVADQGANAVCYDGRFIWAAAPGDSAAIMLLDPVSGAKTLHRPPNLPPAPISKFTVVPLEAGYVAAVGRLGTLEHGRTWVGTFRQTPDGVQFRLIHQAMDVPESGSRPDFSDPKWSFSPEFAYTLPPPKDNPKGSPVAVFDRKRLPAVVDPDAGSFNLLRAWPPKGVEARSIAPAQVHDGAWYCTVISGNGQQSAKILKVSLPGPTVEVVNDAVMTYGTLLFHEGRPYIYTPEPRLYRALGVGKPFEPLELDWPEKFQFAKPRFASTQHHGLVIFNDSMTGTIRVQQP
jgi:hypothetical protein